MIDSENLVNNYTNDSLLLKGFESQVLYVKSGVSVSAYIAEKFALQTTSDKPGYDKYVAINN